VAGLKHRRGRWKHLAIPTPVICVLSIPAPVYPERSEGSRLSRLVPTRSGASRGPGRDLAILVSPCVAARFLKRALLECGGLTPLSGAERAVRSSIL
jgi:hypothetical protein